MVKLASSFSRLCPVKIMVIGDFMLDTYTIGKARRISPEAPVAVIHVHKEEHRPGGAGNVVLNLASLGADVVAVGRVGKDWGGEAIIQFLKQEKIDVRPIFTQEGYRTPVKNRVIAENQQIVRIDHEQLTPLPEHLEQSIIDYLSTLLGDIKVIAISDYGKGFLTPSLLSAIIAKAKEEGILVITDPKGQDFLKYQGTTFIKPNLSEAYSAANLSPQAPLENVAKKIIQITQAEKVMITRSEAGISLFDAKGNRQDFPVHAKEVKDVTGAGDTVLAMLTYALANQLSDEEAIRLCNIAAGIAIEHVGCACITLADLAHRLLELDVSNKVFDEDHLFALTEVLKKRPFILLALNQIEGFNSHLFQAIKELAQHQVSLLVYLSDAETDEVFVEMLASLQEINFILVHSESLKKLCEIVTPIKSYIFENNTLKIQSSALKPSLISHR